MDKYYHRTHYTYDERGNIIEETLYGNLSGVKNDSFWIEAPQNFYGNPIGLSFANTADSYSIFYDYSNDGYNLLLKKTTPECEIHFDYIPKSDLLQRQLVIYNGKIQERLFHTYDKHGVVIQTIQDDGSHTKSDHLNDVTTRKIITVQPLYHENHAAFGKPLYRQESYFDVKTQQLVPLKKTEFQYNTRGLCTAELIYDANGQYRYSLTTEYDSRDRVIAKTDALNQRIRYAYDDHNNKIEEEFGGKLTRYHYDSCNRLTDQEELHPEGESFRTSYSYDKLDRIITSSDRYGNVTTYSYDRLGNQIKCIKPSIVNQLGELQTPTTYKKYNIFGQAIEEVDEKGNTTHTRTNTYGKPILITYPDSSQEKFTYYHNGRLQLSLNIEGTSTRYKYDAKGNLIHQQTFSSNGTLLKQLMWNYKGELLLSKTDAMGNETTYEYDGAGRQTFIKTANRVTYFTYDSLGRLLSTQEQLDSGERIEWLAYDNLDRVIEKTECDHDKLYSKETFVYDTFGNRIETSIYHSSTPSVYKAHYHSGGWLLQKSDPMGYQTSTLYDHNFINPQGQRVLRSHMTDPLGRITVETHDAYGRPVREELHAPHLISYIDYFYDVKGQKIEERHHEIKESAITKIYAILRNYDWKGNITSIQEENKITRFDYNGLGLLTKKIKQDGTSIEYQYDSLGRLSLLSANDISYHYDYDLNDNCIQTTDNIRKLSQYRKYDAQGYLLSEELTPGNTIVYHRDILGRILQVTLPDKSQINYRYDPFHLTEITLNHETFCSFHYDLNHHRLNYTLPTGHQVRTIYDLLGRPVRIEAPQWIETLDRFDPLGNLLQATINDRISQYTYDEKNQLLSENEKSYRYDSLYNRLEANKIAYSYNRLNQIESIPHDLNGNLLLPNCRYDALDRLVQLEDKRFIYDPFDRLIIIQTDKEKCDLLYIEQDEIGAMQNGSLKELKVIDPNTAIPYAIKLEDKISFTIQDHIGNIAALIDNRDVTERRYTAFSAEPPSDIWGPWGFASKREIADLIYFGRRFYNPSLGRWITPDPIYFDDGPNLYAYVKNNPMTRYDPYGLTGFSLDSGMDFIKGFGLGLQQGSFHPIDSLCDFNNCQSEGSALYGEMAGKSLGLSINAAFMAESFAASSALYAGNALLQCGKYATNRLLARSAGQLGAEAATLRGSAVATERALQLGEAVGSSKLSGAVIHGERIVAGEMTSSKTTFNLTPKNFFRNKTYAEMDVLLTNKFGPPKGVGAFNKSFFNKRTERTFNLHRDPLHWSGKPHVDIRKRGLKTNYYKNRPFFLLEE